MVDNYIRDIEIVGVCLLSTSTQLPSRFTSPPACFDDCVLVYEAAISFDGLLFLRGVRSLAGTGFDTYG
jgi:hypothetical protein